MNNPWKILSSKIVYKNPWMTVREDSVITPEGKNGMYGVVESKDSVIIGALNDKNEIYLIYSFSYPAQSWQWELPGGGSDGEDILEASKRELAEETGIVANEWIRLPSTRVCDGLMTERTETLIARDIEIKERPVSDDRNSIMKGRFFPLDEVRRMVDNGEIDEGQSITALYLIDRWLSKNEK